MPPKENIPTIEDIFSDFDHPNPHINRLAALNMREYWSEESIEILTRNLDSNNIELRRKSVKALGYFGKSIVKDIIEMYISSEEKILKVSCLKVLVIVSSSHSLDDFEAEIKILIESAVNDQSVEIILTIISFLRQNGEKTLPYLKCLCRDENVLKAKAAVTAISEINEISVGPFLQSIVNDSSLDEMVRESVFQAQNLQVN